MYQDNCGLSGVSSNMHFCVFSNRVDTSLYTRHLTIPVSTILVSTIEKRKLLGENIDFWIGHFCRVTDNISEFVRRYNGYNSPAEVGLFYGALNNGAFYKFKFTRNKRTKLFQKLLATVLELLVATRQPSVL